MLVWVTHPRTPQAPWVVTAAVAMAQQPVMAECALPQARHAPWDRCVVAEQRAVPNLVTFVHAAAMEVRCVQHNSIAAVRNCASWVGANAAPVSRHVLTTVIVAMECAATVRWVCLPRRVVVRVVRSWSLVHPPRRVVRGWNVAVDVVFFLDVHHRVRPAEWEMLGRVVVGTNVVVSLRELIPNAAVHLPSQLQKHRLRAPTVSNAAEQFSAKAVSVAAVLPHKPASETSTVAVACFVYVLLDLPPPRWEPVPVSPEAVCVSPAGKIVVQAPPAVQVPVNKLPFRRLPCVAR
jgi:hypothetical protein